MFCSLYIIASICEVFPYILFLKDPSGFANRINSMSRNDDDDKHPLLHSTPEGSVKIPVASVSIGREATQTKGNMKTTILVWLTLQNSIHTLLIRYSRAREVDAMFVSTVAVWLTEVIKCFICLFLVAQEETPRRFIYALKTQILEQPFDTLKVCIPAMIYIVQNNLFYVAASHLDAATFMITSQLKIFTAAIFTVIILRRSLNTTQWFALGVLFVGVSLVQLQGTASKTMDGESPFTGFVAVVVACCLSGFAGIYFEKILKGSAPVSLWMRNVQMAVFAIPSSFLAIYMQDAKTVNEYGLLYGFDSIVWLTVLWYGIGGLSVAVCIKYADNIAKNFATSVAIVLSTIGSMFLFDFIPSLTFLLGAALVIFSIFLYSSHQSMVAALGRLRGEIPTTKEAFCL
uniref:UDP-galactose transporter n=2 Tax=Caenorhabditis japonica TaxID=281687 RepID=A0A8R1I3I7_CAEJA